MKNLWNTEPVAIVTLVQAAITLMVSFGFHLTADQTGAILTFTTVLAGFISRTQVHSPSTVEAIKQIISDSKTGD